ncbi:NAD(P)-dependent oxidoreductase [Streptomyces albidus (ex Kaewkla and Franco 2022)]|uniref:NAD(P)-dependent oxidoreductase n=1 Tax=Streptomyces albidus (ex Kaewkla and Franco 2022) TaxID=722709 RepID=UPI0015EFC970|nr:NAD(P)H-binding protein [Streptomyces albidus (ex Kaewkla and Franco 2022)]
MKLAVFGGTGRTGHHLIRQALDAGHDVTAVVRDPSRLEVRHERLDFEKADVFDPHAVAPAVDGADAVVTALGKTSRSQPHVLRDGTRSIITAMRATGTRRLVAVSNSVHTAEAGDSLGRRLVQRLLRLPLSVPLADVAAMEREVAASGLDWTILRPARMKDGSRTGNYRLAVGEHVPGGWSIVRGDVADAILRVLDDERVVGTFVGQAH